jgi:uncharacterized protein (TIGR03435 family)
MSIQEPRQLATSKRVGLTVLMGMLFVLADSPSVRGGQGVSTQAPSPAFEAASIHSRAPGAVLPSSRPIRTLPGGRLEIDTSLRRLIAWAYGLRPYQRVEGPSDVLDQVFVIAAKASQDLPIPQRDEQNAFHFMTQSLLRDRFGLRVTTRNEVSPVMVIRRIRPGFLGSGLKPFAGKCVNESAVQSQQIAGDKATRCGLSFTDGKLTGVVEQISDLASYLTTMAQAPVMDETGVVGAFES